MFPRQLLTFASPAASICRGCASPDPARAPGALRALSGLGRVRCRGVLPPEAPAGRQQRGDSVLWWQRGAAHPQKGEAKVRPDTGSSPHLRRTASEHGSSRHGFCRHIVPGYNRPSTREWASRWRARSAVRALRCWTWATPSGWHSTSGPPPPARPAGQALLTRQRRRCSSCRSAVGVRWALRFCTRCRHPHRLPLRR